jgi:hypothetical protein
LPAADPGEDAEGDAEGLEHDDRVDDLTDQATPVPLAQRSEDEVFHPGRQLDQQPQHGQDHQDGQQPAGGGRYAEHLRPGWGEEHPDGGEDDDGLAGLDAQACGEGAPPRVRQPFGGRLGVTRQRERCDADQQDQQRDTQHEGHHHDDRHDQRVTARDAAGLINPLECGGRSHRRTGRASDDHPRGRTSWPPPSHRAPRC